MSVKLKDTIYDLINNSDKLDGKDSSAFALTSHGVHWHGFSRRTSGLTWGTLTETNGYSPLFWLDSTTSGGVAFSDQGSQTSMQIDGFFYQNEGKYLVLDSNNYGNYTVTKNGTGASGTWGINISGNAATSDQLKTSRTIWGQSFNGTGNVSGDMRGVGNITTNSSNKDIYLKQSTDSRNWWTGIGVSSGDDKYVIYDATAEAHRLTIDTSGNVCIGITTSNWGKLHVHGNGVWTGRFSTDKTHVALANPDGAGLSIDSTLSNTGNGLLNIRYGQTNLGSNGTTAFIVKDNGNVGIGTISPEQKLHVSGTSKFESTSNVPVLVKSTSSVESSIAYYGKDNYRWVAGQSTAGISNAFGIWSDTLNANAMTILSSGNVGIATTSPSYKLHVNGSFNATTIYQNGTPINSLLGNYLPLSGGTLSGTTGLTLTNSSIWIQGGSAAGGNSNRLTTTAGMPSDMQYYTSKRGTRIYSNGIAFCDPYNGNNNNDSGWIRHLETTANKSIFEIATGDDGESSEEIRFRKYNTSNNIVYDVLVPMASGTLALTSQIPTIPTSLPANGGNSDTVDGYHATDLVREFWTNAPGYNGNTYNNSSIVTFSYSNNTPYTGVFIDLNSSGYGVMFNTNYGSDTQLAYRRHGCPTDGGMGEWRYLIDNKTIGSQSVNYANSSGSATTAGALTNLTRTTQAAWGTLTSTNGYTDLGTWNESNGQGGSWSIQSKGGQISMQIDGDYYANEGRSKVIHTGNISSYIPTSLPANGGNADTVDGYHASSLWRSDGGKWNPAANITLTPTANGQEWSFDMSRGSYTGCYWHVWENTLGSCLKVEADNGKVTATYTFNCGTLQIGGETITFTT